MNRSVACLSAALALVAGCASVTGAPSKRPLALDTHVDIPLDYMRQPHLDAGGDSVLQVDLAKMQRGGMDAAFLVIYVGQGPLSAEGYADAMAQAASSPHGRTFPQARPAGSRRAAGSGSA